MNNIYEQKATEFLLEYLTFNNNEFHGDLTLFQINQCCDFFISKRVFKDYKEINQEAIKTHGIIIKEFI